MINEAQSVLYTTLTNALSVPVYDDPEGASYPYVSIDLVESNTNDYLNTHVDNIDFYLTIWSNYRGKKEVAEIAEAIYEAIHRQRIPVPPWHVIEMWIVNTRVARDIDELTYMGNITVRVSVQRI